MGDFIISSSVRIAEIGWSNPGRRDQPFQSFSILFFLDFGPRERERESERERERERARERGEYRYALKSSPRYDWSDTVLGVQELPGFV